MSVLHTPEVIERITLSTVASGYEPEIFKSSFQGWLNFEHSLQSAVDEDSEEGGEESKRRHDDLLPENIWIN